MCEPQAQQIWIDPWFQQPSSWRLLYGHREDRTQHCQGWWISHFDVSENHLKVEGVKPGSLLWLVRGGLVIGTPRHWVILCHNHPKPGSLKWELCPNFLKRFLCEAHSSQVWPHPRSLLGWRNSLTPPVFLAGPCCCAFVQELRPTAPNAWTSPVAPEVNKWKYLA